VRLSRRSRRALTVTLATAQLALRSVLALVLTIDAFDVGLGLVFFGVGLAYSWPMACIVAGAVLLLMAIVPQRRA
jgi:putative Mn2+ efflux pump MntP